MKKPPQSGAGRAASTGPRSAEGKVRSSMNALKSGIYSKSLTIPGEDRAQLDTLLDEYLQRYRPALPEQRDQVDILVRSTWTLRRLAAAEAQVWTYAMDRPTTLSRTAPLGHALHHCDSTLARLQRMVNATQRNYRDALHQLERLQSLDLDIPPPPVPGIPNGGPVPDPQPPPQPAETEPIIPSGEFVSSSSSPHPQATQENAPKVRQNPLPFHRPGSRCLNGPDESREIQAVSLVLSPGEIPPCPRLTTICENSILGRPPGPSVRYGRLPGFPSF